MRKIYIITLFLLSIGCWSIDAQTMATMPQATIGSSTIIIPQRSTRLGAVSSSSSSANYMPQVGFSSAYGGAVGVISDQALASKRSRGFGGVRGTISTHVPVTAGRGSFTAISATPALAANGTIALPSITPRPQRADSEDDRGDDRGDEGDNIGTPGSPVDNTDQIGAPLGDGVAVLLVLLAAFAAIRTIAVLRKRYAAAQA